MNAGKDYAIAKKQAQANADLTQTPRYLFTYAGTWWISKTPTAYAEIVQPTKAEE